MSDQSGTTPTEPSGRFRPAEPASATPSAPEAKGLSGMFQDASTLAATGLIAAVLFAVVAGAFKLATDLGGIKPQLLALTETVDVGDVALLGIAVVLLLLTPDPPGGIERSLLLRAVAVLAFVIAGFGVLRAILLLTDDQAVLFQVGEFLQTIGVAFAAATVGFYATKESFLKKEGTI